MVLLAVASAACSGTNATAGAGVSAPSSSTASGTVPNPAASAGRPGHPAPTGAVPVESNPPGDIPDNVAYVSYRNAAGRYSFVHPEGWGSVVHGAAATFTDKLNGVTATGMAAATPPTVASAKREAAHLRGTQPAFELRSVQPTTLPGGAGVRIVFRRNSAPDPVTGKRFRDEVQRYEIYRGGREVVLDLYGAVGSDNVDPYTKMAQSLRLS